MKAITRSRYGAPDVLERKDIKAPVPAEDAVGKSTFGSGNSALFKASCSSNNVHMRTHANHAVRNL